MGSKYLSTQEAADYVGGNTNSRPIVAWMKKGRLEYVRNPSVRGRYKTTTEWLDTALRMGVEHETTAAAE
jgi:hypothetical protein